MNIITRNIPNSITCLNIAAGCIAVFFALNPDSAPAGLSHLEWAYIFIGIAAIADFCDGFAARLLRAYTDLGKELDSLCDGVSFGVAPAALLFATLTENGVDSWVRWFALLIPVAGVLRLARFNIDTRQTSSFIGLPIPANAIFWIGYTSMIACTPVLAIHGVVIAVVLVESWLMVSPIRLFSLKFKTWGWKGNQARWILIVAALAFIICCGINGFLWLIVFYVLLSQLPFARI